MPEWKKVTEEEKQAIIEALSKRNFSSPQDLRRFLKERIEILDGKSWETILKDKEPSR